MTSSSSGPAHDHTPSRFLTHAIPGIRGVLKARPEDFIVEEIPLYEPSGQGDHLYLFIQKVNLATMHVVRLLADHFGVHRDDVGFAGLKDKLAVTTQLFSIPLLGRSPESFGTLEHAGLSVLWIDRHANKIKRGHLQGNRFVIKVRNVSHAAVVHAHKSLAMLVANGAPNRVGAQRFGVLGNNHLIGLALLKRDWVRALDLLLGPGPGVPDAHAEARQMYTRREFREAMLAMPGSLHTERRVLAALSEGASPEKAIGAIERMAHGFYIAATQSAVFNAVLDRRLDAGTLAALVEGDVAMKHDSLVTFPVDAAALADQGERALAPRLARREISPTGPMWGPDMPRAAGAVDGVEVEELERFGLSVDELARLGRREVRAMLGARRPLRVPVLYPDIEGGMDEHGEYVKCRFELPRGAFATTVMAEIMKTTLDDSEA